MRKPLIVALCGQPKVGKSAIQEVLQNEFNIEAVDDGEILRRHCKELFGLSDHDVLTQEGKDSRTNIQGTLWENRKILGEYGAVLEKLFGELTIPNYALREALHLDNVRDDHVSGYSFGSVRRGQGKAYAQQGGVVIEIQRTGVAKSQNVWDGYDQRWVNHTFENRAESLVDLSSDFKHFFKEIMENMGKANV